MDGLLESRLLNAGQELHPPCRPAGSAAFCTRMPPPLTLEDIGPGDDCDHQNRSDILSFQKKLLSSLLIHAAFPVIVSDVDRSR